MSRKPLGCAVYFVGVVLIYLTEPAGAPEHVRWSRIMLAGAALWTVVWALTREPRRK